MTARSLARAILRRRIAVIVLAAVVSALAVLPAGRVGMESSIEIWFLENDPSLASYRRFLDRFGADEFTVIGVFAADVFAPEVVEAVRELTTAAAEAPHVHRVVSIATVDVFESRDGGVEIAPLVGDGPVDARRLRERAVENEWVAGNLVSADGRATAVLVELDPAGNDFDGKTAMAVALRDAAARVARPGIEIRLSGTPVFDEAFFRYANRDMARFGPIAAVVVCVIVAFLFRRAAAVLVSFTTVALSILWVHAFMGLLGIDVNLVSTMLGALILAIGIAESIHVIADFDRGIADGRDPVGAAEEAVARLLVPCFFTTATTVAGLLSLLATDLRPIAEFGWLAAIGVSIAFVLSLTLAPALLATLPPPRREKLDRLDRGGLARALDRLGRPTLASSRAVAAASVVIVGASALGIAWLEVGANPIDYFKRGDPIREDVLRIDEALGGGATIEFLIEAPGEGLLEPDVLRRVEALERSVAARPAVGRTLSILDALRAMNRAMNDGRPAAAELPDSRELAAQYFLLMEGEEDFDAFVQDGGSIGRLSARVSFTDSGQAVTALDALDAELARDYAGAELRVEATGFLKLIGEMENYILESQIGSFGSAFVSITVMMMLLLRSIRLGAFSMIPNVAPVVIGLGIMGWTGIALDPATVMIASIALGIVVDDTVHFLHRLREPLARGADLESAIHTTMTETGRPIVATSMILAAGYGVLSFGSFAPNVHFGIVSACVIVIALAADLVMLPAALVLVRPRIAPAGEHARAEGRLPLGEGSPRPGA